MMKLMKNEKVKYIFNEKKSKMRITFFKKMSSFKFMISCYV